MEGMKTWIATYSSRAYYGFLLAMVLSNKISILILLRKEKKKKSALILRPFLLLLKKKKKKNPLLGQLKLL